VHGKIGKTKTQYQSSPNNIFCFRINVLVYLHRYLMLCLMPNSSTRRKYVNLRAEFILYSTNALLVDVNDHRSQLLTI